MSLFAIKIIHLSTKALYCKFSASLFTDNNNISHLQYSVALSLCDLSSIAGWLYGYHCYDQNVSHYYQPLALLYIWHYQRAVASYHAHHDYFKATLQNRLCWHYTAAWSWWIKWNKFHYHLLQYYTTAFTETEMSKWQLLMYPATQMPSQFCLVRISHYKSFGRVISIIITWWWVLYSCRNSLLRQKSPWFDRKSPSGNSCCWTKNTKYLGSK